jgi:hypothetical protein
VEEGSDDRNQQRVRDRLRALRDWGEDDRTVWGVLSGGEETRAYQGALDRQLKRFGGDADNLAEYLRKKFKPTDDDQRDDAGKHEWIPPPHGRPVRVDAADSGEDSQCNNPPVPEVEADPFGDPQPQRTPPRAESPAEDEEAKRVTDRLLARAPAGRKGFLRLPHLLTDSGIVGLLDRRRLWGFITVLLRHADMESGRITASRPTLRRKGRVSKLGVVDQRLKRLTKELALGDGLMLPALLKRERRKAGRDTVPYAVRTEGLQGLVDLDTKLRDIEKERDERLHRVRHEAGKKGGRPRKAKQALAARFAFNHTFNHTKAKAKAKGAKAKQEVEATRKSKTGSRSHSRKSKTGFRRGSNNT